MICKHCKKYFQYDIPEVYGNRDSDILIVGEALVQNEVEPFIGRAGEVLWKCFDEIGVNKEQFRIINAVCYSPINTDGKPRSPDYDEIESCQPHLLEEILRKPPKAIITLGHYATASITGLRDKISSLRGTKQQTRATFGKIPCYPTWHPSYILRGKEIERATLVSDLQKALAESRFITSKEFSDLTYVQLGIDNIENYLKEARLSHEWTAFDTETTGNNGNQIIGVSFSYQDNLGGYLPLLKRNLLGEMSPVDYKNYKDLVKITREYLVSNDNPKIAFNSKFDLQTIYKNYGYWVSRLEFDPMLAYWLMNEEHKYVSLDFLTKLFFPLADTMKTKVKGTNLKDYSYISVQDLVTYASEDSIFTRLLGLKLMKMLEKVQGYSIIS